MKPPEPVTVFSSPSGRVRLEVVGRAPLDQNDVDWIRFLGGNMHHVNERLAKVEDDAAPAAGGGQ